MSRIQDILQKAESEGTTFRLLGVDTPPSIAPLPMPAKVRRQTHPIEPHVEVQVPALESDPAARVVSGTRLDGRLVTAHSMDRVVAEQYRAIRTRITNADPAARAGVLLVTSAQRGEGKTTMVGNLGLSMAGETHRRVCLVDASLRSPQLDRIFGLPDGPGLCDVLLGRVSLDEALVTLEDHRLTILPAGQVPSHSAELLGATTMRKTIEALRARFDRVLIDAPHLLSLADVGILSPLVDRILVVVRAGATTRPALHDALASLDQSKVLGVVLNDPSAKAARR